MPTKAELAAELKRLAPIEYEYALYKQRVRAKAIEVANDQEWCRDGLNEALEELDLDKVPSFQRRTAVISVTYTYDPAENPDDAEFGEIFHIFIGKNHYTEYEIEAWDVEHEDPVDVFDD